MPIYIVTKKTLPLLGGSGTDMTYVTAIGVLT